MNKIEQINTLQQLKN